MAHDEPTDEELIQGANGGDRAALSRLCDRYLPWAYRVSFGILVRYPDAAGHAEEAAQEAMTGFCRLFPGFSPAASVKQKVFELAVRESRRLRDRIRRRREQPGVVDRPVLLCAADDPERRDLVRAAVETLPEHQRDVVVLRFWLPAEYAEIAAAVQIPLGTVKSRLHQAILALRANDRLRGLWDE